MADKNKIPFVDLAAESLYFEWLDPEEDYVDYRMVPVNKITDVNALARIIALLLEDRREQTLA